MARVEVERARFRVGHVVALASGVMLLALGPAAGEKPAGPFAGFPPIGKASKGERSTNYSEHEDSVCKPFLAAFDKQEFLRKK